jgi:hypothetical protein
MVERNDDFEVLRITGFKVDIIVEKGTKHVLYCLKCGKALYTYPLENSITRRVAQSQGDTHSAAYTRPHPVVTFDLPLGTDTSL